MKVLMVGATGTYASLVLPELTKRGVTVRALVRNEGQAEAARQKGAQETATHDSVGWPNGVPCITARGPG